MDKLAVEPLVGLAAKILDLIQAFDRAAQAGPHGGILVKVGYPGLEFRFDQQIFPRVDVGR